MRTCTQVPGSRRMMSGISGRRFFASWSGGKDSCLALHKTIRQGGEPAALLTMMREDGQRSRSHGLPVPVLEAQADSLKIPISTVATSWEDYEMQFVEALRQLRMAGICVGVFGDIDLEEHREWVRAACSKAGVEPVHPIWGRERKGLLDEFIREGFEAIIVSVEEAALDKGFLGRSIDEKTVADLERAGVDASGEGGEYHTLVTSGPTFSRRVDVMCGRVESKDGYAFLDVAVAL